MSQGLRIRYRLSVDDMVSWNLYHWEHSRASGSASMRHRIVMNALLLLLTTVASLLDRTPFWVIGGIVFVILYFVILKVWCPHIVRTSARKTWSASENRGVLGEITLEIADDGIHRTTDVGEGKTLWAGIDRIEETPDLGLIYMGAVSAHVISRNSVIEGDYGSFMAEIRKRFAEFSDAAVAG